MRRALVVIGKAPAPGVTKTRLIPTLSAEDAADLYRGFLLDCVALGRDLGWERVSVVHPAGGRPGLANLLPADVCLLEQPGRGLADALSHAFQRTLADGFRKVVLIGSDNPTLPAQLIHEACAALDEHDLSIGPTADGGYYLLGLRAPHPGVFEAIDWSTNRVYTQTLARARTLNLSVHTVPVWYDIDEPGDLERLEVDLHDAPPSVAPRTREVIDRLRARAAGRAASASDRSAPRRCS